MTRVWHYTPGTRLGTIVAAGVIEPTKTGIAEGETPAVWFTGDPAAAPVTHATWRTPDGWARDLPSDEAAGAAEGLIRVAVDVATPIATWDDHKRDGGLDPELATELERRSVAWGANTADWHASYEPVPAAQWISIEYWSNGGWHAVTEVQVGSDVYVLDAQQTERE